MVLNRSDEGLKLPFTIASPLRRYLLRHSLRGMYSHKSGASPYSVFLLQAEPGIGTFDLGTPYVRHDTGFQRSLYLALAVLIWSAAPLTLISLSSPL